jgi:FeS assembly SUF system protein
MAVDRGRTASAPDNPAATASPAPADARPLEERVIEALKTVHDPEIPVNIYELGLIYTLDVGGDGSVAVAMTLTTPHCPAAASLPADVERAVQAVPGVGAVKVEVVWEPPWSKDRMSEAAQLELGFF